MNGYLRRNLGTVAIVTQPAVGLPANAGSAALGLVQRRKVGSL